VSLSKVGGTNNSPAKQGLAAEDKERGVVVETPIRLSGEKKGLHERGGTEFKTAGGGGRVNRNQASQLNLPKKSGMYIVFGGNRVMGMQARLPARSHWGGKKGEKKSQVERYVT